MVNNFNSQKQNNIKLIIEYRAKSDQIIRKMLNVLTNAHKKVDEAEYKKWISTLNNKI